MDLGESRDFVEKENKQTKNNKQEKRGKAKNKLDVAHNSVGKATSADTVGANFITLADNVTFTVNIQF